MNKDISLNEPLIFMGILLGAMFPYLFSACLIRSINRSFLAIIFDIKGQIEEIPSMSQGSIDADFLRTNSLFGFQCMLSLKRFIVVVIIYAIEVVLSFFDTWFRDRAQTSSGFLDRSNNIRSSVRGIKWSIRVWLGNCKKIDCNG